MQLIDGERIVTVQIYDDQHEEFKSEKMSIIDFINTYTDEGAPINARLTNSGWICFLSDQFNISRNSAREMLHAMMSVKKKDNFKKQFSGRKEIKNELCKKKS